MTRSRTALVVGGGNGIGAATARRLAADGFAVVVADLDASAAADVADRIKAGGGVAAPTATDATSPEDMSRAVDLAVDTYGRIDAAVLSVYAEKRLPVEEMPPDVWDRGVDLALGSGYQLARAVIPRMRNTGGGSIVFISSVQAFFGFPDDPAYSAAKAGLIGLTRQLAVQYGPERIRVNAIVPSFVLTPTQRRRLAAEPQILARTERSFPLRRVGLPDDMAAAVSFLVSDDAAFITGVDLKVDGGVSLMPATHWARITDPPDGWVPLADLSEQRQEP